MRTFIRITNEGLFNTTVVDVDTTGLIGLNGTISIKTEKYGWMDQSGEHGEMDYEKEFGFILVVEN